jgi:hypothetical protein
VNVADLGDLATNFGKDLSGIEAGAASRAIVGAAIESDGLVPEPSSLGLPIVTACAVAGRMRRRETGQIVTKRVNVTTNSRRIRDCHFSNAASALFRSPLRIVTGSYSNNC